MASVEVVDLLRPTTYCCSLLCCRVQAALGNVMANLIPRAQIVTVVKPELLHPDPAVVSDEYPAKLWLCCAANALSCVAGPLLPLASKGPACIPDNTGKNLQMTPRVCLLPAATIAAAGAKVQE